LIIKAINVSQDRWAMVCTSMKCNARPIFYCLFVLTIIWMNISVEAKNVSLPYLFTY